MSVNISCVVDDHPLLRMQAWNWLLSLEGVGSECRVFLHHLPGALNDRVQQEFRLLGATLVEIQPFGATVARYCNKIRQLENPDLLDADYVILSDADIVFLRDPALLARPGGFRAKTVDYPNPPEGLWSELLARAGLTNIGTVPLDMEPETRTFATNFNGGLYVMPAGMARRLAPLWRRYAEFALGQQELLGDYLHHADQLGVGLGLIEGGMPIDPLPAGANLPTHHSSERLSLLARQDVSGLHYHSHVDQHGLPRRTGVDWIDAEIDRACEMLIARRRSGFSNEVFWDFRYAQFPELGSGLGSRDDVLSYKQALLHPYITAIGDGSILDVGCGDLAVFETLPARNYTGIDISEQALAIARGKRPDWSFHQQGLSAFSALSFDYCTCIDVLIHQSVRHEAERFVQELVRIARKGVIFSVHSQDSERSGISFNSAGLKNFIAAVPEISGVYAIGTYRDVTLYLAEKGLGERRTWHDVGLHELAIAVRTSADATRLNDLVAFSREKIGFFPRTVIRSHEYPWFAEQMRDCDGKKILDVGAGVCLLPFYLAERGAEVTTVDSHPVQRLRQPRDEWNEWGFLDYGAIEPRIRSFNADIASFDSGDRYDTVYSVSVVEHMPARDRRRVIGRVCDLLVTRGSLLLSVDLVPGTDDLWNLSEGVVVDAEDHGALRDLRSELTAVGLSVISESRIRNLPLSRTDVALLVCRKE